MSTIEITSQNSRPLDDSPSELALLSASLLDDPSEAEMRERARAEFLAGRAATVAALRYPEITAIAIDAEWGVGTRYGILKDITDEEALALRLFMRHSNIDGAEAIAHKVFSTELTPELEMTQ